MRSLLCVALMLAACTGPELPPIEVTATPEPACMRWEEVRAVIPPAVTIATVSDPAGFLAAFNALPPTSDARADEIRVARAGRAGHVWLLTAGCVTDHWMMPWEAVIALIGVAS